MAMKLMAVINRVEVVRALISIKFKLGRVSLECLAVLNGSGVRRAIRYRTCICSRSAIDRKSEKNRRPHDPHQLEPHNGSFLHNPFS